MTNETLKKASELSEKIKKLNDKLNEIPLVYGGQKNPEEGSFDIEQIIFRSGSGGYKFQINKKILFLLLF